MTAFHHGEDGGDAGAGLGLPMWIQFLRPVATGRMEFSARLLESSSCG